MKNINKLQQKLQKLNSQEIKLDSLEDISIFKFIKYKSLIHKKKQINKQLKKSKLAEREANLLYDVNVKSWFNNQTINCRQYCKLERKAEYKRNLVLYKLGLMEHKPIHPLVQNTKQFFSKITLFKTIYNKYNFFKSHILPKKINTIAVGTAKVAIKGYQHMQSNCKYVKNYVHSRNSFKYLQNVLQQASSQLADESHKQKSPPRVFTNEEKKFRESIKFVPNPNVVVTTGEPTTRNIKRTTSGIKKISLDYNL